MNEQEIINTLSKLETATPKPFLATRVKAALQKPAKEYVGSPWLRWAIATVMLFNVYLFWDNNSGANNEVNDTDDAIASSEGNNFINNYFSENK